MCSWCWGYRPVHDELRARLPASVKWKNLLGGLAPDSDVPMPEQTRLIIMNHWRNIQQKLGTEFNFDFWTKCKPRRSTYPACRAVLAAAEQGAEEEMIDAIQRAYYLRAMNPSDKETLIQLAEELGLNKERFVSDLISPATHQELLHQIGLSRTLGINSFPSLVLVKDSQEFRILHDYHSSEPTLIAISKIIYSDQN
jgi:putative protein-disulfide isomerase